MRRSKIRIAGLMLVLTATLVVAAGSPATASASGGSCSRLGDKGPSKISASQARRAVLCLLNKKREKYGLGPLGRNKQLQRAAQKHSNRMENSGCFSHQCGGEGSLDTRLRSTGYLSGAGSWGYSENIAWAKKSRATPSAIVEAWMGSAPHRSNILNGSFDHVGIGFAEGTPYREGANGGIYTADFGRKG